MSEAFSLSKYNQIVSDVNDIVANAPDGCSSVPALTPLSGSNILKTIHWLNIQAAISQYAGLNNDCPSINWQPLKKLWAQSTIAEIYSNLGLLGDCNCGCSEEALAACRSDNGTEIHLATIAPTFFGNDPAGIDWTQMIVDGRLQFTHAGTSTNTLAGMTVSGPGCRFRGVQIRARAAQVIDVPEDHGLSGGGINCAGQITIGPPARFMGTAWGVGVDPDEADDDDQNTLAQLSPLEWYLLIDSDTAQCCEDGDT
jgi:hypothetical protein